MEDSDASQLSLAITDVDSDASRVDDIPTSDAQMKAASSGLQVRESDKVDEPDSSSSQIISHESNDDLTAESLQGPAELKPIAYNSIVTKLLCGTIPPGDFKKTFSCHDVLYKSELPTFHCAEDMYPWYRNMSGQLPRYVCRTTEVGTHCPFIQPEDNKNIAFESGRCQALKDVEKYPAGLHDYVDLFTEGGRQLAIWAHLRGRQETYETPFVSTHDCLRRSVNRGLKCGGKLLTIISTKKLLQLGYPIVPAPTAMKNYSIDSTQKQLFDTEWLVLWHIPRAAVVETVPFHESMVHRPQNENGDPTQSLNKALNGSQGAHVSSTFLNMVDELVDQFEKREGFDQMLELVNRLETTKTRVNENRKRVAREEMDGHEEREKKRWAYRGGDFAKDAARNYWKARFQAESGEKRVIPYEILDGLPSVRFLKFRDRPRKCEAAELSFAEFKAMPTSQKLPTLIELEQLRSLIIKACGDRSKINLETMKQGEKRMSAARKSYLTEIANALEYRSSIELASREAVRKNAILATKLRIPEERLAQRRANNPDFNKAIDQLLAMRDK